MSRPKPWWTTYPRELWSPADWRAARKAGVVPPLPAPDFDVVRPLASGPPEAALPGGLYGGDPDRDAERRRRRVDQMLEARGVRPRGTW